MLIITGNSWYAQQVNGLPVAVAAEPTISKDHQVLRPMLDAHSIESVTLTCEYDGDINSAGLSVIKEEASRLKLKYQNRRIARRPSGQGDSFNSEQADILGYSFLSRNSEKDLSKFDIVNDNSNATSFAYTNFKSFLADILFSLEIAHKAFSKSERKLEKIVLSYSNSFLADNAEQIHNSIRVGSPYVASACLDKTNFWHSRIGFFSNDPYEYPLVLHNLEVTHKLLKGEGEEFEDGGLHTHQLQIDNHHVISVSDTVSVDEFSKYVEARAYELKNKHVEIFSGVLKDEVLSMIGLSKDR